MRRIISLSVIGPLMITGLLLVAAPAMAQTADDPNAPDPDPALEADAAAEGTDETAPEGEGEPEGEFSRSIPKGLKANLSEEELADVQAQLDAATTPQERNAIRKELHRTNQERHLEKVQATKTEKQKGFFESLSDDFNNVVSGKAAKDAKARTKADGDKGKATGGKDRGGKDRGGKDRGGKDRGGKDRGGRGK